MLAIQRKRVLKVLEIFERAGFTRRVGEGHRLANALHGEQPVPGGFDSHSLPSPHHSTVP